MQWILELNLAYGQALYLHLGGKCVSVYGAKKYGQTLYLLLEVMQWTFDACYSTLIWQITTWRIGWHACTLTQRQHWWGSSHIHSCGIFSEGPIRYAFHNCIPDYRALELPSPHASSRLPLTL